MAPFDKYLIFVKVVNTSEEFVRGSSLSPDNLARDFLRAFIPSDLL
jgi:hypothetical protein